MYQDYKLNAISLAVLLVFAQYGLGFVFGTAEAAMALGAAGSLYAVSIGIGKIALTGLAKVYWTEKEQIWTLLGERYGNSVKAIIGLMIWSSLIGVGTVQILSVASTLELLGIPRLFSMLVLAMVLGGLAWLPVERISWLFQGLLLLSFWGLLYALWSLQGLPVYWHLPLEFLPSLKQVSYPHMIGISVSTILLVFVDMTSQQFLVRAKDLRSLYQGCLLAAVLIIAFAFLPSAIAIAAQHSGILPPDIEGRKIIPYILLWAGGGTDRPIGILLLLSLLIPALGVGSSVLRIQTKIVFDFDLLKFSSWNRLLVAAVNVFLAFFVALKVNSLLIDLIVAFYSVYVSSVIVPFAAYLLARAGYFAFSEPSVRLSLGLGGISALITLIVTFLRPETALFGSIELSIMSVGLSFSSLGLLLGQAPEKPAFTFKLKQES